MYGLKSNIRKTVVLWISVISLILGPLFNNILNFIYTKLPLIKTFIDKWEYVGVFSTQLSAASLFGIISWLFNQYIWKSSLIIKFTKVPDLNGVWEGVLESSHRENGQTVKINMGLTIKQTWEKMTCLSIFPKSESYSDIIFLDTECPGGPVLKFTYTNKSHDLECNMPQYLGFNELRLVDKNTLSGTYFTQRPPNGTKGNILLIKRTEASEIHEVVTT